MKSLLVILPVILLRGHSAVLSVVKGLAASHIWTHTWEFTRERNHLVAPFVVKDFLRRETQLVTWDFIQERNRSAAPSVRNVLDTAEMLADTWESTQERKHPAATLATWSTVPFTQHQNQPGTQTQVVIQNQLLMINLQTPSLTKAMMAGRRVRNMSQV